jgi:hypothetical protein
LVWPRCFSPHDCVSGFIEHGPQFIQVMQGPLVIEPSPHLLDLACIPPTRLCLTSERRYRSRTQGCPARNRDYRNRARHAGNRTEAHNAWCSCSIAFVVARFKYRPVRAIADSGHLWR